MAWQFILLNENYMIDVPPFSMIQISNLICSFYKNLKMQRTSYRLLIVVVVIALLSLTVSTTTIANCYIYSNSNTTCSLCDAGYYSTSSGTVCTAHDCSSMPQCSLCDSTTTCLRCSFGY